MKIKRIVQVGMWVSAGASTLLVGCQSSLYSIGVQGTSLSIQSLIFSAVTALTQTMVNTYTQAGTP